LQELMDMFHQYDLNRDGEIQKSELVDMLKDVFKRANMKVDQKVLNYYEFMFDVNGDNAISLEEFILILKKYSMPIDRQ
jgi:Ca2+-binding EF-hand superfamily protein